ncbi:MAG: YvcK family protein, partial [Lachnospiraceae bacterium]|nr:YvcK family protein [Lachnospiraceae bacterium]
IRKVGDCRTRRSLPLCRKSWEGVGLKKWKFPQIPDGKKAWTYFRTRAKIVMNSNNTGNLSDGIEALSKVFNLKGKVIPLTEDNVVLMGEMQDGCMIGRQSTEIM